jgi:hypothetical protein
MAGRWARLRQVTSELSATADGVAGADLIGATAIAGLSGATVQALLESLTTKLQAQDDRERLQAATSGDIVASVTATFLGLALQAGVIAGAVLHVGNTGTDASNPLSLEMDTLINGVSSWTIKPAIAKTAADGARTNVAGTGVTVGVLDPTKVALAIGDIITYSLTLTRTASPSDEMDSAHVEVQIANALLG